MSETVENILDIWFQNLNNAMKVFSANIRKGVIGIACKSTIDTMNNRGPKLKPKGC